MNSSSGAWCGAFLQASLQLPAFSTLPTQLAWQCQSLRQVCGASSICPMDNPCPDNWDVSGYVDWDFKPPSVLPRSRFATSLVYTMWRTPVKQDDAHEGIFRLVWPATCASARSTVRGHGGRPMNGGNRISSSRNDADASYSVVGPTMSAGMSDAGGPSSFLQCVGCGAVYAVESEELEGEARVVRCCTCLHEWYACEEDLLWGDREAAAAIESRPSDRSSGASLARQNLGKSVGSTEETINADDIDEFLEDDSSRSEYGRTSPGDSEDMPSSLFSELGRKASGSKSSDNERSYEGSPFSGESDDNFANVRTYSSKTDISVEINNVESSSTSSMSRRESSSDEDPPSLSYNIFVGNLSFRATEEDLFRAFSGYGMVIKCQIPKDDMGGSRGYGFVEMSGDFEAEKAMDALQGASILGRDICLSKAHRRGNEYDQAQERRTRYEKTSGGSVEFKDRSFKWENRESAGRSNSARRNGWSARISHASSYREYSVWSSASESQEESVSSSRPRSDTGAADSLTPREEDQLSSIFKAKVGRIRNQDRNGSRDAPTWNASGGKGSGRGGRRPRGPSTDRQKRKR